MKKTKKEWIGDIQKDEKCCLFVEDSLKKNALFWKKVTKKNRLTLKYVPISFLKRRFFVEILIQEEREEVLRLMQHSSIHYGIKVRLLDKMIFQNKTKYLVSSFIKCFERKTFQSRILDNVLKLATPKEIFLIWEMWSELFNKKTDWRLSSIEEKRIALKEWSLKERVMREKRILEKVVAQKAKRIPMKNKKEYL